jgi:dTDP-glucose pyrophosphorylase
MKDFNRYIVSEKSPVLEALERLNTIEPLTLFVVNEREQLVGTLTDGDIRRGLVKGLVVKDTIGKFMHTNFRYLSSGKSDLETIDFAKKNLIKLLPLLDKEKRIYDILDLTKQKSLLPVDAILMAGGRGERLRPLTDHTPKSLLMLGNKAIIEYNIDNLSKFGIKNCHISVKYLAEKIMDYLGTGEKYGLNIKYLKETEPLGTIGSVSLVDKFESDTVLVMNSDLFTNLDLEEFYLHFLESGADMAIASFPYVVSIPYGVLNTQETEVVSFSEKPTYSYHASAGMYLIKKEVIKLVPKDTFYNATDLMDLLISKNRKVTYFPIVGYWIDIGKPDDYKEAQQYVKYSE